MIALNYKLCELTIISINERDSYGTLSAKHFLFLCEPKQQIVVGKTGCVV